MRKIIAAAICILMIACTCCLAEDATGFIMPEGYEWGMSSAELKMALGNKGEATYLAADQHIMSIGIEGSFEYGSGIMGGIFVYDSLTALAYELFDDSFSDICAAITDTYGSGDDDSFTFAPILYALTEGNLAIEPDFGFMGWALDDGVYIAAFHYAPYEDAFSVVAVNTDAVEYEDIEIPGIEAGTGSEEISGISPDEDDVEEISIADVLASLLGQNKETVSSLLMLDDAPSHTLEENGMNVIVSQNAENLNDYYLFMDDQLVCIISDYVDATGEVFRLMNESFSMFFDLPDEECDERVYAFMDAVYPGLYSADNSFDELLLWQMSDDVIIIVGHYQEATTMIIANETMCSSMLDAD